VDQRGAVFRIARRADERRLAVGADPRRIPDAVERPGRELLTQYVRATDA
jgi:hypothetical protein